MVSSLFVEGIQKRHWRVDHGKFLKHQERMNITNVAIYQSRYSKDSQKVAAALLKIKILNFEEI